jgi:hypothetical protein
MARHGNSGPSGKRILLCPPLFFLVNEPDTRCGTLLAISVPSSTLFDWTQIESVWRADRVIVPTDGSTVGFVTATGARLAFVCV